MESSGQESEEVKARYARYLHSKSTSSIEEEHGLLDPYEETESPLIRIEEWIGKHGLNRKDFFKHTKHFTRDQSDHMMRHGLALEAHESQTEMLRGRHLEPLHISFVKIRGRSQRVYRDRRGQFARLQASEQVVEEKMLPKDLPKSEPESEGKSSAIPRRVREEL